MKSGSGQKGIKFNQKGIDSSIFPHPNKEFY